MFGIRTLKKRVARLEEAVSNILLGLVMESLEELEKLEEESTKTTGCGSECNKKKQKVLSSKKSK